MAITFKHPNGKADTTGITPTGTQSGSVFGPPTSGNPNTKGVYVVQVAGASGTYRHVEDIYTPGTASPSTWVYL